MDVIICNDGDIIYIIDEYNAAVMYFDEHTSNLVVYFSRREQLPIDLIVSHRIIIQDGI